jgi:pimeloyl-ACP methyl ester carboxylesterase
VLLVAVLDGVRWDPASERGMQMIGEGLRSGGLDEARAAWLRHDFFAPARRMPGVARRLAEMVGDYSGVNWTSADPHAPHPNSLELLATIPVATTVVSAELDVPCFREMSYVLADRIPGARKVTVPGAGHMVNMEAPKIVNALLREVVLNRSLA